MSLYGILHLPKVQTWIIKKVASSLSDKLHTKVSIESVEFTFFYQLKFKKLLIEDQSKDTLLYAGAARVSINDWFFTKDKIVLKYVGLDDAVVNLKRTKEDWNYQFMIDYFVGSSSSKSKSNKQIEFEFKKAEFNNIRFNRIDKWKGEDMLASVKHVEANIDSLDLETEKVMISSLILKEPVFAQTDYQGNRPRNYQSTSTSKDTSTIANSNKKGFALFAKKVSITNGTYQNDKETERAPFTDYFDPFHFAFKEINGELNNIIFQNDSLSTSLKLSSKEKNGFEVKQIKSDVLFTSKMMEFTKLDLQTPYSHLKDYYAMHYDDFFDDMNEFVSNVRIDCQLKDSRLSSEDIAMFAPEVKSWHRTFNVNGYAKGTVDNFEVNKMNISVGNTFLRGSISLRELPDIDHVYINFNSEGSNTQYNEIALLFPEITKITQPRLDILGDIYFKGNFTGYINNFVAKGVINTNLGSIISDINIKLPDNEIPSYSGNLITNGFKLGVFTDSKQVGDISLNGKIAGSGFDLKHLKANFVGYIPKIEFNGYHFKEIKANGNFEKNRFDGQLSIDDSNLVIKKLDGLLTLSGEEIAFKLNAEIEHANLKNIKLTDQNLNLSGKVTLNFTGNNIDNFLGEAKIYEATLMNDNQPLSFNQLTLSSSKKGNQKSLLLNTNELEAEIEGEYKIQELPDAFKLFLSKYYPTYINKPTYNLSNQDFAFRLKTNNIEPYLQLFEKKISGGNDAFISGHLNLSKNELSIKGDIPEFGYKEKKFSDIIITGNGSQDTLNTDISIGDIAISDSFHLPETKLQLIANNDNTEIHLKTSASETLNNADLNANIQTYSDGAKIHFYPSSFIIKDKKWLLNKDGELTIRKDLITANDVAFSNGNQKIEIKSELDDITNQSHLIAKLSDVNLEDFIPFAFTNPSVSGRLSGIGIISDPLGKTRINFKGKADSLRLEEKYIGNINLSGDANTQTGLINFHSKSDDTANIFVINGSYNYKDSSNNKLYTILDGEKINLNILEPYLNDIFSSIEGNAISHLVLSGNDEHQYIAGTVDVKNASMKVDYTQCRYFLNNQTIIFDKDLIKLSFLQIKDSLNNSAVINGKIHHTFFDNFYFDKLELQTSKLSLLNTNKFDNSQFYGNVVGRANMSINGPLTNLLLNIDGAPNEVDSSHIYIPTSEGKESNTIDYIEFVQFGKKMEEVKTSEKTNIVVNLKINANPSCKVDVILDEETGDIIKGQGNGVISIRVGNIEPLSILGTYKLTKGEYTFNFQTFLKKPFTLNRGTLTWNGDPYQAIIDIDAEYLAKNVDISSLSTTGGFKQKEDVTIISHLNGILQNPTVTFDFELPEKSEAKRDDIITKRLADFKNDENEMNKQVASLLLFNTFITSEQNFLSQGNASTLITSTIGGVISNLLTNFFNKELEKATKGILSTYIDINPTLDLQKSASLLQANIRAGLKILLNNRLIVLVGGNLDYNNPNYVQQKGLLTPDITIEWLINKDGTVRVVGFNKSSIDFSFNQRNRSGLQLSYRKDINKISDIFKSRKKIAEEDRINNMPAKKPEDD
jgi:hypothetical protein